MCPLGYSSNFLKRKLLKVIEILEWKGIDLSNEDLNIIRQKKKMC